MSCGRIDPIQIKLLLILFKCLRIDLLIILLFPDILFSSQWFWIFFCILSTLSLWIMSIERNDRRSLITTTIILLQNINEKISQQLSVYPALYKTVTPEWLIGLARLSSIVQRGLWSSGFSLVDAILISFQPLPWHFKTELNTFHYTIVSFFIKTSLMSFIIPEKRRIWRLCWAAYQLGESEICWTGFYCL